MEYVYNNIKVNYFDNLNKKQPVVLLHGWGQNIDMMKPIGDELLSTNRVIIIDFPGFGKSEEPLDAWDVSEYTNMLRTLLIKLNVDNPILIGHSFGCRVAIKYSNLYPVKKMIFTGGAGIRPQRGINYYVKVYTYKTIKMVKKLPGLSKVGNSSNYGSEDYRNASDAMKGTFVKVVNEDLKPLLKNISCPVLLIWGKNDEATPLSDGMLMEQLIADSALITLEGTHYAYLENISYFNVIVKEFIK